MAGMPQVSVLMPVFNTASYLRAALESVFSQTFPDFEIIAIDDGSTDDSAEILHQAATTDDRLKPNCRSRKGLVQTRNELLQQANGELVAWMDSDDLAVPERLALQVMQMQADPELLCLGGACLLIDPDGLPIMSHAFPANHEDIVRAMEQEIAFYFPTVMMRREAALRVGGFREPFAIAEDFDLCLRLSESGRVANLPQTLLYYRQHLASTANAGRPKTYAYSALARQLARERRETGHDRLQRGETVRVQFDRTATRRQNANDAHARWAWWALGEGHLHTARKYALRTLKGAPLSIESWRLALCALRGH